MPSDLTLKTPAEHNDTLPGVVLAGKLPVHLDRRLNHHSVSESPQANGVCRQQLGSRALCELRRSGRECYGPPQHDAIDIPAALVLPEH